MVVLLVNDGSQMPTACAYPDEALATMADAKMWPELLIVPSISPLAPAKMPTADATANAWRLPVAPTAPARANARMLPEFAIETVNGVPSPKAVTKMPAAWAIAVENLVPTAWARALALMVPLFF